MHQLATLWCLGSLLVRQHKWYHAQLFNLESIPSSLPLSSHNIKCLIYQHQDQHLRYQLQCFDHQSHLSFTSCYLVLPTLSTTQLTLRCQHTSSASSYNQCQSSYFQACERQRVRLPGSSCQGPSLPLKMKLLWRKSRHRKGKMEEQVRIEVRLCQLNR